MTKALEVLKNKYLNNYKDYIGLISNNTVYSLNHEIDENEKYSFISKSSNDGYKILTRTLTLVAALALKMINEEAKLYVEHFIGGGLYVEFSDDVELNIDFLKLLKSKMQEIIEGDYKIERHEASKDQAIEYFENEGLLEKAKLLKTLDKDEIDIYSCKDRKFTFHGYLAPSTAFAGIFDLKLYYPGVVIMFPSKENPGIIPEFKEEKSLAKLFARSKKWTDKLGIGYVSNLNNSIENGDFENLVNITEAYYENSISKLADKIIEDDDIRFILLAGPSSSGKTTTASRLATQLAVRGKKPFSISVDDYFVERAKTPLNEKGEPDYETIHAIDIEKFNRDLLALLDGNKIKTPIYNFKTGLREESDNIIYSDKDNPIIIEGIHALNPDLTLDIPNKNKFKVYISALTQLNLDMHNRISTTDVRLIRRCVRDKNFRGYGVLTTIKMWENVRKGEEKWIFPYQDQADYHIDSSLIYELAILKKHIIKELQEIDQSHPEHKEAKRLIKFLEYFKDYEDDRIVPTNSVLREFIGR